MILWSGTLSPFSLKVRIYMRERDLLFELRDIPWNRTNLWGPKPTAFLQASLRGEVPALEDGELKLFDSTLIWQYLESAYPRNPLAPAVAAERAVCAMWEDEADRLMAKPLVTLIQEIFLKPDGGGDTAEIADSVAQLHRFYQQMDRQLEKTDWLCGEYSIADVAAFVCCTFAQTLGAAMPEELPALAAWYQNISDRPVVQLELAELLEAASQA